MEMAEMAASVLKDIASISELVKHRKFYNVKIAFRSSRPMFPDASNCLVCSHCLLLVSRYVQCRHFLYFIISSFIDVVAKI